MTEIDDTDKKNIWEKNSIVKLCSIRIPFIQAPMAEVTTPRLVAAISNAGGLGSLGAAYLPPSTLRERIREIRTLTQAPFAVNLFAIPIPLKRKKEIQAAQRGVHCYRQQLGLGDQLADLIDFPDFNEQISVIIEEKVPVFSFTFGIPSLNILQRLKREQIVIMGTATTVEEAMMLEKCGVDAIILQGIEAGGHRGTFIAPDEDQMLTLSSLLTQTHSLIQLPLIAAGGIMHGETIASNLLLGASAVQMGTAFLCCPESGATKTYKKAIINANGASTVLTKVFSGRTARAISNRFIKEMQNLNTPLAPFPYQNQITKEIRASAAKQERPDLIALYAGQNYALATNLPASELFSILEEQTINAISKLHSLIRTTL